MLFVFLFCRPYSDIMCLCINKKHCEVRFEITLLEGTSFIKSEVSSFDLTGLHADSLALNYKAESPEPAFRLKNLTAQKCAWALTKNIVKSDSK